MGKGVIIITITQLIQFVCPLYMQLLEHILDNYCFSFSTYDPEWLERNSRYRTYALDDDDKL